MIRIVADDKIPFLKGAVEGVAEVVYLPGNQISKSDLVDADGLILVTEWSEFRIINYTVLNKLMKNPVVFDGRNIYDPDEMKENGIMYYGVGRNN